MTRKQLKFANSYIETGNATEAAMQVYKPKNRATARSIGSENLTKPNIQKAIKDELSENGLSNELVIRALVDDIKSKPAARIHELFLASKILGLLDRAKKEEERRELPLPTPIMGGLSIKEK